MAGLAVSIIPTAEINGLIAVVVQFDPVAGIKFIRRIIVDLMITI
jgi:hypothetical protein